MNGISSIALGGMQTAQRALGQAAQTIADAVREPGVTAGTLDDPGSRFDGLALDQVLALIEIEHAFAANLEAFRVAERMIGRFIDTTA